MQLSRIERLMLSNQLKILKSLDEDEYNVDSYEKQIEALESGYEAYYSKIFDHIRPEEEGLTEEECREVRDILCLFADMQFSYSQLKDSSDISPERIKFAGFSGNEEGRQMAYAEFVCKDERGLGQISLVHDKSFNSHFPMLSEYRRKLEVWKQRGEPRRLDKELLSELARA